MKDYIRVCDVEKYYGTDKTVTKAVDRVSFTVERGEFIGVMGASGSGKTTLLNMISAIDRVTAGHIFYENTDITELSEDQIAKFRKDNLGFVFQEYNLLDTLTLEENIMLAMSLRKEKKGVIEKECREMLRLLEIEEVKDQFPYQVSGGAKTALCLCKSIGESSETDSGGRTDRSLRFQGGTDPFGDLYQNEPGTKSNYLYGDA